MKYLYRVCGRRGYGRWALQPKQRRRWAEEVGAFQGWKSSGLSEWLVSTFWEKENLPGYVIKKLRDSTSLRCVTSGICISRRAQISPVISIWTSQTHQTVCLHSMSKACITFCNHLLKEGHAGPASPFWPPPLVPTQGTIINEAQNNQEEDHSRERSLNAPSAPRPHLLARQRDKHVELIHNSLRCFLRPADSIGMAVLT